MFLNGIFSSTKAMEINRKPVAIFGNNHPPIYLRSRKIEFSTAERYVSCFKRYTISRRRNVPRFY